MFLVDLLASLNLRPGPASEKRRQLELLKKQEEIARNVSETIVLDAASGSEESSKVSCDNEVELKSIEQQLRERGLKVRPGPMSKKKAYFEKVKRKEETITCVQSARVRPCPASKKHKYLAKGESWD